MRTIMLAPVRAESTGTVTLPVSYGKGVVEDVIDDHRWTVAEVTSAASAALGRAVTGCAPIAGSVTNQDFVLELADGDRALVKIGAIDELAAEAWALPHVAAAGFPAPPLLAFSRAEPMVIIGWVAGRPSTRPAVLQELGRRLRRLHAIALPGYGPLLVDDHGQPSAPFPTWGAYVAELVEAADALAGVDLLSTATAVAIRGWTDRLGLGAYAGPGCLSHGDIKEIHVFADGDTLTAVIDWGDVSAADPRWDLCRISMMGEPAIRAVLDGYGLAWTPALARTLAGYRLLWNADSLITEYRAGGDWFDAYRDRIHADLAFLDADAL